MRRHFRSIIYQVLFCKLIHIALDNDNEDKENEREDISRVWPEMGLTKYFNVGGNRNTLVDTTSGQSTRLRSQETAGELMTALRVSYIV